MHSIERDKECVVFHVDHDGVLVRAFDVHPASHFCARLNNFSSEDALCTSLGFHFRSEIFHPEDFAFCGLERLAISSEFSLLFVLLTLLLIGC